MRRVKTSKRPAAAASRTTAAAAGIRATTRLREFQPACLFAAATKTAVGKRNKQRAVKPATAVSGDADSNDEEPEAAPVRKQAKKRQNNRSSGATDLHQPINFEQEQAFSSRPQQRQVVPLAHQHQDTHRAQSMSNVSGTISMIQLIGEYEQLVNMTVAASDRRDNASKAVNNLRGRFPPAETLKAKEAGLLSRLHTHLMAEVTWMDSIIGHLAATRKTTRAKKPEPQDNQQ